MLERLFSIRSRGSTPWTEVRAGAVTFLTMAYILAVNPQILSAAGMPAEDVVIATALASALACLVMGLFANLPFALAPGMGLNAYFAFSVVGGLGISWQTALGAIFVEGLLFLVLSWIGLRSRLLDAIPRVLKQATMAGIGLFLAFIGLQSCGLVEADPATLVTLGDLHAPTALLALAGILIMASLLAKGIRGAILWAVVSLAGLAWAGGLAPPPEALFSLPRLPQETLLAFEVGELLSWSMLSVVLAFFFVDLLDTAGTLMGVGQLAGFVDEDGRFPGSERAFVADAVGTSLGAVLGTSTVTTYIESATGVEDGGRSGLTAIVTACFFLASLFLIPLFVAIPAVATAPALIVVGASMMRGARDIDWSAVDDALPAFLTLAIMPLTFSIAHGIAAGILSWCGLRILGGRWREIPAPLAWLLLLLLGHYALAAG